MKSRPRAALGIRGLQLHWAVSCHPTFLVSTVYVLSFSIFNAGMHLRMRRGQCLLTVWLVGWEGPGMS